jgi:hypothetical protein
VPEVLVFLHDNGVASGHRRGRVSECCDSPIEQSQRDTNLGQNKEFKRNKLTFCAQQILNYYARWKESPFIIVNFYKVCNFF